jgi:hypothetical protein
MMKLQDFVALLLDALDEGVREVDKMLKKQNKAAAKARTIYTGGGVQPVQGVRAMALPDKVEFNEEKRTTTLVWYKGLVEPVVVKVRALESDKFDKRTGFLEAWFKATNLVWNREDANAYLDNITK